VHHPLLKKGSQKLNQFDPKSEKINFLFILYGSLKGIDAKSVSFFISL